MYYDDEARRFNFVSGLLLGAVLGTGVALLMAPQKRLGKHRRIRRSTAALRSDVTRAVHGTRGHLEKSAESLLRGLRDAATAR